MKNPDLIDILVVEDNPYDAELFIRTLLKMNLDEQVFVSIDGEEALDFIFCREKFVQRKCSTPLKAIFLDLKIPKVSGLEVLKEIKSNPLTMKIPLVIVTSSREDVDIKEAYELGANSYVVKPVEFDSFHTVISKMSSYWLSVNETPG
jgi:two-component system, response regulator